MRLFIEPTEPLLFRTGRPFDAGESNFAESIFPPTPETLQGAIRATIATYWDTTKTLQENFQGTVQGKRLTDLIGDRNSYGRFRITGIALGRRSKKSNMESPVECLYPMPSLILQEENKPEKQVRLNPESRGENIHTNLPMDKYLLYMTGKLEGKPETRKSWLTAEGLRIALWEKTDIPTKEMVKANDIFTNEPRLGIGMNNQTKATREGLLYQVNMIRMNHRLNHPYIYGFVVDIRLAEQPFSANTTFPEQLLDDDETQQKLKLPDRGWLTLGGERRAARFEVVELASENTEPRTKGNLLYLATPAAFDRGWQPASWTNWAEPVAAAMERYQPIGGWLLTPGSAGGENKPQRRCVPAGSIYFFKESVNTSTPFTNHGQAIGYGITFAGEW